MTKILHDQFVGSPIQNKSVARHGARLLLHLRRLPLAEDVRTALVCHHTRICRLIFTDSLSESVFVMTLIRNKL